MAKILVVDDEPGVLAYVTEALEMHDHEVVTATNGVDAADKCCGDLDLVLTDLVMPQQNGINMIKDMRRSAPDMKVVAMSGGTGFSGEFDLLSVAKLLGVKSILQKPFSAAELLQTVSEALADNPAEAPDKT